MPTLGLGLGIDAQRRSVGGGAKSSTKALFLGEKRLYLADKKLVLGDPNNG